MTSGGSSAQRADEDPDVGLWAGTTWPSPAAGGQPRRWPARARTPAPASGRRCRDACGPMSARCRRPRAVGEPGGAQRSAGTTLDLVEAIPRTANRSGREVEPQGGPLVAVGRDQRVGGEVRQRPVRSVVAQVGPDEAPAAASASSVVWPSTRWIGPRWSGLASWSTSIARPAWSRARVPPRAAGEVGRVAVVAVGDEGLPAGQLAFDQRQASPAPGSRHAVVLSTPVGELSVGASACSPSRSRRTVSGPRWTSRIGAGLTRIWLIRAARSRPGAGGSPVRDHRRVDPVLRDPGDVQGSDQPRTVTPPIVYSWR